jgi:hypothetical protein
MSVSYQVFSRIWGVTQATAPLIYTQNSFTVVTFIKKTCSFTEPPEEKSMLYQGSEEAMKLASSIILEKFCPKILAMSGSSMEGYYLAGRKCLKVSHLQAANN